MKRTILMAALLAGTAMISPASANLVQFDAPGTCDTAAASHCGQFVDIGSLGFGNAPRLLTLQEEPAQSGFVTPSATGPVVHGNAIPGDNKASTPTVGSLGWLGGSGVAIGYNLNQNSGGGPLLTDIALTIYSSTFNPLVTFHLDAPTTYDEGDRGLQQGNGNGIFGFVLDTAQRLKYTALVLSGTISGSSLVGLGADMGCADRTLVCASNDGADSFLALKVGTPIINPTCPDCVPVQVPSPVVGMAGLPGLIAACAGLLGLARRRRQKIA